MSARHDLLTSINISKHEIEARDTKLGPEEITREIPNQSEEMLANLDDVGLLKSCVPVVRYRNDPA